MNPIDNGMKYVEILNFFITTWICSYKNWIQIHRKIVLIHSPGVINDHINTK